MDASLNYRPRRPEEGALYQIVRDHYETFCAQAAGRRDGHVGHRGLTREDSGDRDTSGRVRRRARDAGGVAIDARIHGRWAGCGDRGLWLHSADGL